MPTNFPGSNDVFNVPSTPSTTKLKDTGDGSRSHTQHHRDLGDALMAMQAEATYKTHTHDGATFRYGNKLSGTNTHQSPDTNTATSALHHTIGTGANQYASGMHTHAVIATYPVGAYFFAVVSTYPGATDPNTGNPGLGLAGTWTAVGQRFLCASDGALGFAAGTTGGSNSHTHTIDANTDSVTMASHTLSSVATSNTDGSHPHNNSGGLTSTGKTHTHTLGTYNSTHAVALGGGGGGTTTTGHAHSAFSSTPSHSHSAPATDSQGAHGHSLSSAALSAGTTHTHTNSSPATTNNLLPLLAVYMWKRTA